VLLAGLLGLMRFLTVLGAIDTGSSFEGMGASREVLFSALAEPALLLSLAVIARKTANVSLSGMYSSLTLWDWYQAGPALALAIAALMIVFLTENARIPVDDPNTHLELTMIHEVMVLDHGGPDFALIQYGAALKMWVLGALISGVILPVATGALYLNLIAAFFALILLAVVVGVIESIMARLRLLMAPQLLVGASALALVGMILLMR
jgi:formate hydrogenlyase subunit 4